ncbi:MAG: sugar phosphate nucleotidyltransferase [Kiritimatiellia bacterium]|nr:sugar phosphate nucleotidyltransferase [Kiritimatiellia bacterium]MDP6809686.1 sugar phosphate nucleotidyltransferase [Kiritimatiellia bacterium]MDP7023464.1 sugar phosphate nucleotidyltransferase [Kiritimatiellia bacterium]
MNEHRYAMIMAGGRGERFWPLSTSKHPKQVLSLLGDRPMLAMSVDYLEGLIPPERVLIITSADLVDVTCEAVPSLPRENVIGEPFGRDTAACIALASAIIRKRDPEGVFCVLTADHIIRDLEEFQLVLGEGMDLAAKEDVLLTIGIEPTFPSSGFGYIETDSQRQGESVTEFWKATRFVEKPDVVTAERYLEAGNFYWNSGMFMWSCDALQKSLGAHQPHLYEMARRLEAVTDTPEFTAALEKEYSKLEKISIDFALMEKAGNIVMARGRFRWDDIGSWEALKNHFHADRDGNTRVGDMKMIESDGNIVVSKDHFTALIGVKDLIVVQAEGATLVCHKSKAQDVKTMVTRMREQGGYDHLL